MHTTPPALAMNFSWSRRKREEGWWRVLRAHTDISLFPITSLLWHLAAGREVAPKRGFIKPSKRGNKSNPKPKQTSVSLCLLLSPLFLPFPFCFYHVLFSPPSYFPYLPPHPFLPLPVLFPLFSPRHPQKHLDPLNSTFKRAATVFQWPVRGTWASLLCHQPAL